MTNETADLFIEHEEKNNMDMELERMAAELEITVDYLMAEFLWKVLSGTLTPDGSLNAVRGDSRHLWWTYFILP